MAVAVVVLAAIVAAVVATRGGGFDREKVQPAWNAYVALASAVQVGVTYADYGDLVQDLATEVNLLSSSKLSGKERQFATSLQGALAAYQRALEVWRQEVQYGAAADEDAIQSAWAEAGAMAEVAIAMMAGGHVGADDPGSRAAQDAAAKSLVRNAMAAMESAFVDAFSFAAITKEALQSIEPSITWLDPSYSGVCTDPPTAAQAQQNAVGWAGTSDISYEIGTWSASGTSFGVRVEKSPTGGNTFYIDGVAADW